MAEIIKCYQCRPATTFATEFALLLHKLKGDHRGQY